VWPHAGDRCTFLSVAPFLASAAALFLSLWPWRAAAGHLVLLAFLSLILAEFCLHGTQRIPFTCSYLPGKSNFHITFWLCVSLLVNLINWVAKFEMLALEDSAYYVPTILAFAIAATLARWRTVAVASSDEAELQFEDAPDPAILSLGLNRDGVTPIEPQISADARG
jgi:hypothetical protein